MYKTEKRLMADRVWWKDQSPELKSLMIKQQEYWQTLTYTNFKKLFEWSTGVYHIGQTPIRHLYIGFPNLTETGLHLPLQNLKVFLLKRAEYASLKIVSMALYRRIYNTCYAELQVLIDFGEYVGITPYTFQIPADWGRTSFKLRPVWNWNHAIEFFANFSSSKLYYNLQPQNSLMDEDDESESVIKLEPDQVDLQIFSRKQLAKMPSGILEYSSINLTDQKLSQLITSQMPHVVILCLNNNLLTFRSMGFIADRMPNLEQLQIFSNKICDQGLSFLVKLKNLKRLNLEDCGIHDYGVAILSNIGTLECLNISFNQVSDVGISTIASLKKLQSLKLFGNNISQQALNRLRILLPNCQINN